MKVPPVSLGVGMYQHDVSASKLESRLDEVVTRIVSEVGVNVNTASKELLRRVSGLNRKVASAIYDRARMKPFRNRESLLKVKGLGKKMYAQCAGFLRIPNGTCPYDNTNVHPESYDVARLISSSSSSSSSSYVSIAEIAKQTNRSVEDVQIVKRFIESPGNLMDPRNKIPVSEARTGPLCMKDLKDGMILSGVVSNRMPYGLFVNIGVETDALLHFGKLSHNHRVRQLGVSSTIRVKVESVDMRRQRISVVVVEFSTSSSTTSVVSRKKSPSSSSSSSSFRQYSGQRENRSTSSRKHNNKRSRNCSFSSHNQSTKRRKHTHHNKHYHKKAR